jgi:hypothetical protein
MRVVIWYRCTCGKLHLAHGTNKGSTCSCGSRLWPALLDYIYGTPEALPRQ